MTNVNGVDLDTSKQVQKKIRALGVVLPQFHPIPENNEWWGKGFTEWTNVAKAKPQFRGHYQPHIPADLGFYDLRLEEARIHQAELAKEYNIYGFCYYHYWFHGKRLLERPIDEIVASGKPDFPFCLCWANEPWNRNWDGFNHKVLQDQVYSDEDHLNHITYLIEIFKDKRYIKVDGRPLFIVYKAKSIPNVREMLDIWNKEAKKAGFEKGVYFLSTTASGFHENPDSFGFEGSWDFLPHVFTEFNKISFISRIFIKIKSLFGKRSNRLILYKTIVNKAIQTYRHFKEWKKFPCVCPCWDNTPRRQTNAWILHNSTPELYEKWLASTCDKFEPYSEEENFVFINAMNEWAEGNHLEPDLKWGLKYLEATKRILDKYK